MTRILHRVSLAMGARPPVEYMAVVNCPSSGGLTFHSCDPNFHSGNLKSDIELGMVEIYPHLSSLKQIFSNYDFHL